MRECKRNNLHERIKIGEDSDRRMKQIVQKVTQTRRKGEKTRKKIKSSKEEGNTFYLFIIFFFSYFSKNEICACVRVILLTMIRVFQGYRDPDRCFIEEK